MPRYTRSEIQNLVVGQLVTQLRYGESIVDIDDPEFISKAFDFQGELARKLEEIYPHTAPAVRAREFAKKDYSHGN